LFSISVFCFVANTILVVTIFDMALAYIAKNTNGDFSSAGFIYNLVDFESYKHLGISAKNNFMSNDQVHYFYFSTDFCNAFMASQNSLSKGLNPWFTEIFLNKIFFGKVLKIQKMFV
jgi:hypothetical protein